MSNLLARNDTAICAAGARTETRLILTDENSLWGADVYFEVSKDLPKAKMVSLSGWQKWRPGEICGRRSMPGLSGRPEQVQSNIAERVGQVQPLRAQHGNPVGYKGI